MTYPGNLDASVRAAIAARHDGDLRARSAAMSATYRQGGTSSGLDLAAYLTARLPATFTVNRRVMAEAAARAPQLAPISLLDVGAGPGTAGWAALAQWPSITRVMQVEADAGFARLARDLNQASGLPPLMQAQKFECTYAVLDAGVHADLVLASYVLAEMPSHGAGLVIAGLWGRARQALMVIEPGTPQGFARLRLARDLLIGDGAHIAAPCTHHQSCPMTGSDWCHFKARVQRSRLHMHAKSATVPFEDEAFSYLVAVREPVMAGGHRIVAPVKISKTGAEMTLCGAEGLTQRVIPARDKTVFKAAKKKQWGGCID
jgi:ribosomal protein RSM22 (predicted rRNA methylase)